VRERKRERRSHPREGEEERRRCRREDGLLDYDY
jgi:hypothetical protein